MPNSTPAQSSTSLGTAFVERNLDLVGKLYQRSVYPSVLDVAHGKRLSAPLVVDLDPTTVCDLACPECISSQVLHHGQIGQDRIVRLAHELAGSDVRAVILIGGGEPLLHRSVGEIIEVLHGAGIKLGLVTNGTQIHRHLDRLAEMLSWVRVSLDAATAETYRTFRPSRGRRSVFPQVIENMRKLAARKKGRLGYSFLLMQRFDEDGRVTASNYHEVYQAGALARDIGCDYFEVKAMLDQDHYTVNQRAEHIELVEEQIARLRALEDDSFHVLHSSNWQAVRHHVDSVQPKDYHRCAVAELRTTVTPTGVFVCPYHRGNPKGRIGDIRETSFSELWASADTTVIDPSEDCRFVCARHATNQEIRLLPRRPEPPELTEDFDPFI
ncbi:MULTISPECIES: radical SAM protein [Streptomyces]|uniref:Radical SAM core domain-containing protein n=1 Tax=Streptomyces thermogriseus TaxID=75292 RepID=A0ABP4DCM3_9ACTN|nr:MULTISPECIES: radical SAM protein [Streptomyces]MDN5380997.1 radical SAM protein [Streptomyces sp. LB8]